jgi:hypothetical protein
MFLVFGCGSQAISDELAITPQEIIFRNLTWAAPLFIEVSADGIAKWRSGIDASGSGYMCSSKSEFYCLMLDGALEFAIPRDLIEEPKIGAKWQLDDVDFELLEVVGLRAKQVGEQSLVINAIDGMNETAFNFSDSEGIQFMSSILDFSDEENNEIVSSVWVKTALLKDIA